MPKPKKKPAEKPSTPQHPLDNPATADTVDTWINRLRLAKPFRRLDALYGEPLPPEAKIIIVEFVRKAALVRAAHADMRWLVDRTEAERAAHQQALEHILAAIEEYETHLQRHAEALGFDDRLLRMRPHLRAAREAARAPRAQAYIGLTDQTARRGRPILGGERFKERTIRRKLPALLARAVNLREADLAPTAARKELAAITQLIVEALPGRPAGPLFARKKAE